MTKIENLKKLIEEICSDYKNCRQCPLFKQISPYTYEAVCDLVYKIKEEK